MSRMSRWDRPPPPKDVRWFVRLIGKTLIVTGLLMFGFVAYQLWGTGIEYARAQDRAENQFDEMMAAVSTAGTASTTTPRPTTGATTTPAPTTAAGATPDSIAGAAPTSATSIPTPSTLSTLSTTTTAPTTVAPATSVAGRPDVADIVAAMDITEGEAFARMEIPSIGLDVYLYPGVTREDLQNGPGHFPSTPMPGMLGNAALAGHRTTYGQPFRDIDRIESGDEIIVTVPYGRFVYVATTAEIVQPSDIQVIATTDPTVANLTLTSCHPAFSASQRYILYSELDVTQSPAPAAAILNFGRDAPPPTESGLPGEDELVTTSAPPASPPPTSTDAAPASATPDGAEAPADGDTTTPAAAAASTQAPSTLAPAATSAPDPLYNVVPSEGGGGGGGESAAGEPTGNTTLGTNGDAFSNRWFEDTHALPQVGLWAVACAAVAVAAYLLAKRFRNSWIGLAAGTVPFLVALYFFYANVNRLLPAAL